MGQKLALIIATADYQDTGLARLVAPGLDAHDFAGALQSPHIGAFDHVEMLLNEAEPVARRAIARFFSARKPDDLLLLYFSGHGVRDDHGQLFLAVSDTDRALLSATAIPANFINEQMNASRSRRQVLILDCCNSGAFAQGSKAPLGGSMGIATAFEGTGYGRVVLTATDATQYAWEGDQALGEAANSVFTHFLVKGLETGDADANSDGRITLDELYDYVYEQVVTQTPRQTPRKFAYNQQGDVVIANNPRPPVRPAELPLELRQALESPLVGVREAAVRELDHLLRGSHRGLALAALEALEALSQDDSRRVSTAAGAALTAHAAAQQQARAQAERLAQEQAQQAAQRAAAQAAQEQAAREQAEAERRAEQARQAEAQRLRERAAQEEAERQAAIAAQQRAADPAQQQRLAREIAQAQAAARLQPAAPPPAPQVSTKPAARRAVAPPASPANPALALRARLSTIASGLPRWPVVAPWVYTAVSALIGGYVSVLGAELYYVIIDNVEFEGKEYVAAYAGIFTAYTLGGLAVFAALAGLRRSFRGVRVPIAWVAWCAAALIALPVQWVLFEYLDLPGKNLLDLALISGLPGLVLAVALLGLPRSTTLRPMALIVGGWVLASIANHYASNGLGWPPFWSGALFAAIGAGITFAQVRGLPEDSRR